MKSLPQGYKERAEESICNIRDESVRLWNIVREFNCDSIEMECDGYVVIIRKGSSHESHAHIPNQ